MDPKNRCTICLCMIVKDESKVIIDCLKSVVNNIDYWVICDTGSTDGTQDIIKDFFKDKKINGELHEHKWVDFGYNRTLAFFYARGKCDYMYVIDADDRLNGDIIIDSDKYTHVNINIKYGNLFFKRVQIFNSNLQWEYVGILHEHPVLKSKNVNPTVHNLQDCYVQAGTFGNRSQDPEKYAKDAIVLEKALVDEPNNARYTYYLAQSYRDSNQNEKAIEAYKRRTLLGGNNEEIYYSYYMIGKLKIRLNRNFEDEVLYDLLRAFNYRKHRLEALYDIVIYYRQQKMYKIAFSYASMGMNIPKTTDNMMVVNEVYDWMFMDELAACAVHAGFVSLAAECMRNLMKSEHVPTPEKDRIERNLNNVLEKYPNV